MKKSSLFITLLVLSLTTLAQSNTEDIEIIQSVFGKQKKELMQNYLTIPEERKAEFWKLYDVYEGERKSLGKQRVAIIEDYAKNYQTLNNASADTLMNRKMRWVTDYAKLQKKHYSSMSKAIGAREAAKFFQLEDYLENIIRLSLQENIPFIDELDKAKVQTAVKQ